MQRTRSILLSAATTVAALGLGGCTDGPVEPARQLTTTTTTVAAPKAAPLPAPDELTGVLYRLADTSIPAEQKLVLVQSATRADEAALGNFATALRDGGFRALTIQATDLAWSSRPGNVTATVSITSADDPAKRFTYPMEFTPTRDAWQLTRSTADQVLQLTAPAAPTPPR